MLIIVSAMGGLQKCAKYEWSHFLTAIGYSNTVDLDDVSIEKLG